MPATVQLDVQALSARAVWPEVSALTSVFTVVMPLAGAPPSVALAYTM